MLLLSKTSLNVVCVYVLCYVYRCTIVWFKLAVGNIHKKKFCGKNFRLGKLQTIINYSISLW